MSNKKFTPSFLSLMESLDSYQDFVHEDKETRQRRREERSQERREKRFEEKRDLKSFIQNLETLKSQIIANVVDTDHWIKQNPDSSVYPGYKKTFLDLLERVAKVMGDAVYISKKEGKKLEAEDQELLTGLLETYNEIKTEYEGAAEKYSTASTQEVIADQKELKFKDISAKLIAAAKHFQDAAQENLNLLDTLKSGTAGTISGSTTGSTNATQVSDIKIEDPIKKGAGSKKSPNEKVKSVQNAILDKFKNNKDVTASQVWKNFAKYEPDGIFGNATAGIIPPLKAGFKMSDTTSDITQDFVNKISSLKESLLESKIVDFSTFMSVKEDFDTEAFVKAAKSSSTSSSSGSSPKKGEAKKEEAKKEETKKEETKKEETKKEAVKYDTGKIREMAYNVFVSFAGSGEDEEAFFTEIKKIKDAREFELLEENFKKMKIQKADLQVKPKGTYTTMVSGKAENKKTDWQYMVNKNKDAKKLYTIRICVKNYFNSGEIAQLNSYLPDGVEKF